MKNKLFWPIIIVAVVIIVESVLLLSDNKVNKTPEIVVDSEEIVAEDVVNFEWLNETNKATLVMTANKEVSLDAIDLYIAYKNVKIDSVKNLDELPKPSFSKISTEKSLVVINYLISEEDGFKMTTGQSVKVAELEISLESTGSAEFSVDQKTQVVENGSAKVLPFSSKKLIVDSTL